MKRILVTSLLALSLVVSACGPKAPPTLTPAASKAWYGSQVLKDLDVVRDVSVDAFKQGLLSRASLVKVVKFHETAITLVHNAPLAWKVQVTNDLDGVVKTLTPDEQALLGPYVDLVKAAIKVVP